MILYNCKLVDVDKENIIEGSIKISNGIIAKIDSDIDKKEGDQLINLKGHYIMPGLWDVHTHLGDLIPDPNNLLENESIPNYTIRAGRNAIAGLQKGITSVRVVGEDYDACLAWKEAFQKKIFLGPNIFTAVRGISATGGHGHGTLGAYEIDGPYEMRKVVRENLSKGADLVKLMVSGGVMTENEGMQETQLTEDEILAATEIANKKEKMVAAHVWSTEGVKTALRCGIRSIEHGLLDDECIEMMLKKNAFYIPTLCQTQEVDRISDSGLPEYMIEKKLSVKELHLEGFKKAYKAGVKIVCGSDSAPLCKFTFAELNHLNRAGMSTIDTLKSATTISAELCNVSNYLGKLKEGYVADLIVTKNNPIENIKNLENVQMVFKDGIKINDLGLGISEFTNSYYKRR